MNDLKPCPFCGGIAIALQVGETKDGKQYQVICPWDNNGGLYGCGASCGFWGTLKEAIEAWNRRVEPVTSPLLTEKWKRQHRGGAKE